MTTYPETPIDISCSIVLYKNPPEMVRAAIESYLKLNLSKKIYLVDNSPTDKLKSLTTLSTTIEYIKTAKNLGFGKAHNIALKKAMSESKYHLVLNPDVYFDDNVLQNIFQYMENNNDVGQLMPRICYPNGEIQRLCKRLPSPVDLTLRRFLLWLPGARRKNQMYELQDIGYDNLMNVPYLSGCFMFFRTSSLKKVGLFDERFFMYMEDVDLTRRMHENFKTLYYPHVTIFHSHARESYKLNKLLLIHISSAIKYFNKWGWVLDSRRKNINRNIKVFK